VCKYADLRRCFGPRKGQERPRMAPFGTCTSRIPRERWPRQGRCRRAPRSTCSLRPSQQCPQTWRPSGHLVEATPSVPQVNLRVAWAPHVTAQSPRHFTSQFEVSLQETVLAAPRFNLQFALLEQVADERAPAFSSHLDVDRQLITLASPPVPLHSELSRGTSSRCTCLAAWEAAAARNPSTPRARE